VNGKTFRVLKGECKSGARFAKRVVKEAATGLDNDGGRPNPSTLAFITKRLYELGDDKQAKVFEHLQVSGALETKDVEHMIFALAGHDPSSHLSAAPAPKDRAITRTAAAFVVADHVAFVAAVYATHGAKP
jgi:hypothetical protein